MPTFEKVGVFWGCMMQTAYEELYLALRRVNDGSGIYKGKYRENAEYIGKTLIDAGGYLRAVEEIEVIISAGHSQSV